jgi:hypothetical protein
MRVGEWYLIGGNTIIYIDNFLNKGEIVNIRVFKRTYIKTAQPYSEAIRYVIKQQGRRVSKNVVDKLRRLL